MLWRTGENGEDSIDGETGNKVNIGRYGSHPTSHT